MQKMREPVMSGSVMPCPSASTSRIFRNPGCDLSACTVSTFAPNPLLLNEGFFLFLFFFFFFEGRHGFFSGRVGGLRHPWNGEDADWCAAFPLF